MMTLDAGLFLDLDPVHGRWHDPDRLLRARLVRAGEQGAIMAELRRVVTGHNDRGQSVIVADELVPSDDMGPAAWNASIWALDVPPTYPDGGAQPEIGNFLPAPGAVRFGVMSVAAGGTAHVDEWVVASFGPLADPARPGMHRTPTLDLVVVLDGEIAMQLDGGDEVVLRRGDFLVQSGTSHRWENRGDSDAVIAVTMIGAHLQP
jgi:hypothetical protein